MKKCLSIIIAAVMLLAMVPAMAWNLTSDPVDYTIYTAADLQAFAAAVNGGNNFSGKTITLANDINLSGVTWTPIGTSTAFEGTFDGNGKTISNFKIDTTDTTTASAKWGGFFVQLSSSSNVHDLTLSDVTVTVTITGSESLRYVGTLAGRVDGKVTNVTVRNVTATISGNSTSTDTCFVSGLCGYLSLSTSNVTNCTVENFSVKTASPTGIKNFGFSGFAGPLSGSGTLNGNTVKKFTVDVKTVKGSEIAVGGITSQTQTAGNHIKINNFNVSDLDITVYGADGTESIRVGGLVAVPGAQTDISNSSVSGKITAKDATDSTRVGGFMGDCGWNQSTTTTHTITNSSTNVSIDAGSAIAGGFLGSAANSNSGTARPISFENCSAAGSISGQDGKIGGLIGNVPSGQQVAFTNSANNTNAPKDIGNQADDATVTGISASPATLDFGSHALGSDYASKSLETTIKNLGKENIHVFLVPSENFNKYFEYEKVDVNSSANPSGSIPPEEYPSTLSFDDMPTNRARGVDDGIGAGGDSASLGTLKLKVKPKAGLPAGTYSEKIEISDGTDTLATVTAKIIVTAPSSSSSGIDLWYIRGNSFGSSRSAAPTSVEIDGQPVSFVGDGREFTVSCLKPDSKWITAKWNSTSVTISFTPDASAYCSTVAIPKTGDMPLFAAIAAWLGF